MSERDGYPPGVPCWVDTLQADPEAALKFYGGLFGWAFGGAGGGYFIAKVRSRDVAGIGAMPAVGAPPVPAWSTHVAVKSVEDAADRAVLAGGSVLLAPFDALPAGRMAVLADPSGAAFCAWDPAQRRGAQVVNEPRAWAMSMLATSRPQECARFYEALFGWRTESFGPGPGAVTLFRLPGYFGGEPGQPVPRDVVAVMAAAGPGAPPRWKVDFWIEDADAAAARAVRLGGVLLSLVREAGMFRTVVIRDPQGAELSISQLARGT